MTPPEGNLTPAQHEIMEAVWRRGKVGATVAEIWQDISAKRSVTRTTVLNQVDRLEKRRWLTRHQKDGTFRYTASVDRESAAEQLARDFVDDFFAGSAGNLVMSLLDARRLEPDDIRRLRHLLDSVSADPEKPGVEPS